MADVPLDRVILVVLTLLLSADRVMRWIYKRETSDSESVRSRRNIDARVRQCELRHTRLRKRVERLEAHPGGRS